MINSLYICLAYICSDFYCNFPLLLLTAMYVKNNPTPQKAMPVAPIFQNLCLRQTRADMVNSRNVEKYFLLNMPLSSPPPTSKGLLRTANPAATPPSWLLASFVLNRWPTDSLRMTRLPSPSPKYTP